MIVKWRAFWRALGAAGRRVRETHVYHAPQASSENRVHTFMCTFSPSTELCGRLHARVCATAEFWCSPGVYELAEPLRSPSSLLPQSMPKVIPSRHCMTVSLAEDGMGLGTMWGEQKAGQILVDAGFRRVDVRQVEGDVFHNYYIASKS
jgi:hypothetical protein